MLSGSPSARRRARARVAAHPPARPCAAAAGRPRGARGGATGRAQEPGVERAVERLEVLAPRDERRAQRPVDVVLARRCRPWSRPRSASAIRPGPTSSPASRSTRPNVTTSRVEGLAHRPAAARARLLDAARRRSSSRTHLEVLVVLEDRRRASARRPSASSSSQPSAASACAQSIVSATPGGLARSRPRRPCTNAAAWRGEPLGDAGHAQAHDLDLALERRVADPVEQAAALERVVQLARAVGGEHDARAPARVIVPISGIVIWKSESTSSRNASNSSSARSISSISSTTGSSRLDRLQQRAADQELGPEELLLVDRALLRGADVQELARVVPLVDRVRDVEPLVALQADQPRARRAPRAPWPPRSSRPPPRPRAAAASRMRSARNSAVARPRSGR